MPAEAPIEMHVPTLDRITPPTPQVDNSGRTIHVLSEGHYKSLHSAIRSLSLTVIEAAFRAKMIDEHTRMRMSGGITFTDTGVDTARQIAKQMFNEGVVEDAFVQALFGLQRIWERVELGVAPMDDENINEFVVTARSLEGTLFQRSQMWAMKLRRDSDSTDMQ